MAYDAKLYWQDRSTTWKRAKRKDEHTPLVRFLEKYLPENGKILDVGSGDGQIFLFLKKDFGNSLDDRYQMCDFVDGMREKCYDKTGIMPDKWDGTHLPYEDDSFDVVLSISVWLHVPFENIEEVIAEHRRVAKKHIFVATWFDGGEKKASGPHCFHHEYYKWFSEFGLEISEEHKTLRRGNQATRRCWVLKK